MMKRGQEPKEWRLALQLLAQGSQADLKVLHAMIGQVRTGPEIHRLASLAPGQTRASLNRLCRLSVVVLEPSWLHAGRRRYHLTRFGVQVLARTYQIQPVEQMVQIALRLGKLHKRSS